VIAERDDPAAAIRSGSASFSLASGLFDRETRRHVWELYAWCRHCDDVTDGQRLGRGGSTGAGGIAAVDNLKQLSSSAIDGGAVGAPFDGLARVVAATGLPRAFVRDHLTGFEMDARGHRCRTLDDTLAYSYHVAGVVGLMMAWLMGIRDRQTHLRGCDLGIAFQLTNIARDVFDDLGHGRLYLPEDWLQEARVRIWPGQRFDAASCQALVPIVSRLLDEADRYYASAWHGIGALPARSGWAVATARHVYADIGREVLRRGPQAWRERVATTRARKLLRAVQGLGDSVLARAARRFAAPPAREGLWTPPLAGVTY
jgi:phytoene synthase